MQYRAYQHQTNIIFLIHLPTDLITVIMRQNYLNLLFYSFFYHEIHKYCIMMHSLLNSQTYDECCGLLYM